MAVGAGCDGMGMAIEETWDTREDRWRTGSRVAAAAGDEETRCTASVARVDARFECRVGKERREDGKREGQDRQPESQCERRASGESQ